MAIMARMTKEQRMKKASAANARAIAKDRATPKTKSEVLKRLKQARTTYEAQIKNGASAGAARRAFNSYGLTYDDLQKNGLLNNKNARGLMFNSKGSKIVSDADSAES